MVNLIIICGYGKFTWKDPFYSHVHSVDLHNLTELAVVDAAGGEYIFSQRPPKTTLYTVM